MSIIIKNNVIPTYLDTISHTVSSGTVTASTDIEKLADRSVLNAYRFTHSASAVHTINIDLTASFFTSTTNALCVIGLSQLAYNVEVEIRGIFNTLRWSSGTNNETTKRTRVINGEGLDDYYWELPNSYTDIERIVIKFSLDFGSAIKNMGVVYFGEAIEFGIKPKSLRYPFGTQGEKARTLGGQVDAEQNNSWLKPQFTTIAVDEDRLVDDFFDLNYRTSISQPLVFIPDETRRIMFYGTQAAPCIGDLQEAQSDDGLWLYEVRFQLEEEF